MMPKKNDTTRFNRNQYSNFPLENSGSPGQVELPSQPENPPLYDVWNEKEKYSIEKHCPEDSQTRSGIILQSYGSHPCQPQVPEGLNLHLKKRDRQKYFQEPSFRILFWFNKLATRLTPPPFRQKEKRSITL